MNIYFIYVSVNNCLFFAIIIAKRSNFSDNDNIFELDIQQTCHYCFYTNKFVSSVHSLQMYVIFIIWTSVNLDMHIILINVFSYFLSWCHKQCCFFSAEFTFSFFFFLQKNKFQCESKTFFFWKIIEIYYNKFEKNIT